MSLEQYKDANRSELWEILQIQIMTIAELEKERNVLTAFIIKRMPPIGAMSSTYEICKIISDEVDLILEAHNLEQQAKGCFESIQEIDAHWVNGDSCISVRAINNFGVKKQLQAKALNDQTEEFSEGDFWAGLEEGLNQTRAEEVKALKEVK
ncbi:MAG: hypothetical protein ACJASL_000126 [Paraglaciecola sp.]|jgi:hypothetical protein